MKLFLTKGVEIGLPDSHKCGPVYYAAAGGSMGWGFPAAMGMQLARPGDRVITVSGDGTYNSTDGNSCNGAGAEAITSR